MAKPRRCKGKTKAGKRCQSTSLIAGTGLCWSHQPKETKASKGFGGAEPGALGGRPPKPRVVDVLRERVEANVEKLIAPYFDALENAVMHATYEGEVIVSDHPDLGARINAAEKLLDRVYGKPRQTIEHSGPQDGTGAPIELELSESTRKAIGDALRQRPADGK